MYILPLPYFRIQPPLHKSIHPYLMYSLGVAVKQLSEMYERPGASVAVTLSVSISAAIFLFNRIIYVRAACACLLSEPQVCGQTFLLNGVLGHMIDRAIILVFVCSCLYCFTSGLVMVVSLLPHLMQAHCDVFLAPFFISSPLRRNRIEQKVK